MLWQQRSSVSGRLTSEGEIYSGHPESPEKTSVGLSVFCSRFPAHREGTGEAEYFRVLSDALTVQNFEINTRSLFRGSPPAQLL